MKSTVSHRQKEGGRSAAVDNFLFDQPEGRRQLMEALRELIFSIQPDVEESIKWNSPFYSYNGLLCYVNFDKKAKCVALGFVEGFLIEDRYGAFSRDTSQIKKIFFDESEDIDVRMVTYYLRQALKINKTKKKNFLGISKKRR